MRLAGLIVTFFALVAAAPPPPAPLSPYIHGGHFDPGDYGWMRGRFDDASPGDKAAYAAVMGWIGQCAQASLAEDRAELRAMGIQNAVLNQVGVRDPLCGEVSSLPVGIATRSFADFQRALAVARPIANTYLLATRLAIQIGGPRGPDVADALLARPLGEQMIRMGTSWGEGEMKDAPPLPPDARAILMARMVAAMITLNHENTEWLKALVEKQGWPKISQVGPRAATQAWLLVQHADADPPFQLRALRLMEPLLASGDVSKQDYAYLYDRVMLKITGRQRYATQVTCREGRRVPQPLEDEQAVARQRAAMGLQSFPDYLAIIRKSFGDCPPPAAATGGRRQN